MTSTVKSNALNVLLVEGRKLLREGVVALLERHDHIKVVGEAEDGRSAAKLIRALAVDVVVLNVIPPQANTIKLVSSVAKENPDVRMVVLTMDPSSQFLRELLSAGAHGCLTRQSSATELVEAIRTVTTGKTYLSPSLVDVLLNGYAPSAKERAPVPLLTSREQEILARIAAGQTTKQIAGALGVSAKTVETHRRRVMQKLNKHSVAELTKYALAAGLTPLESV